MPKKNNHEQEEILYLEYQPVVLKYLIRDKKPRKWFIQILKSPWFERITIFIIILNCITLGMFKPCEDHLRCHLSTRCIILKYLDHIIYAFFVIDMMIKIFAMGFYGKKNAYMSESWNRLDFIIVLAE